MNYSRPTLVSDWHKHREAEPKDYDITACSDREKKLHKSTYKHFGTFMASDWSTTTESQLSQYFLKKEYEAKDTPKSMVQANYFHSLVFDRETGLSQTGYKSVLPCHRPDSNEMNLNSTYVLDYLPPHVTTKDTAGHRGSDGEYLTIGECLQQKATVGVMVRKADFRRHQSHFTDVGGHRRQGRNTWQDVDETQARLKGAAKPLYTLLNPGCA